MSFRTSPEITDIYTVHLTDTYMDRNGQIFGFQNLRTSPVKQTIKSLLGGFYFCINSWDDNIAKLKSYIKSSGNFSKVLKLTLQNTLKTDFQKIKCPKKYRHLQNPTSGTDHPPSEYLLLT